MTSKTYVLQDNQPDWVHYICFRCWCSQAENVVYSDSGGEVVAIYLPEGRYRVPGMKIYVCCCCGQPERHLSWFVKKSADGPFCEHNDDGSVRTVYTLYRNRGIGSQHPPSSLKELLES